METPPVKPCRRKEVKDVWCQPKTSFENDAVEDKHLAFAESPILQRPRDFPIPKKITAYFCLDDSVDIKNPWGSCPLLKSGSNFRVSEYSRHFNEFSGVKNDDDTSSNTCFIYSQKNPNIEIVSKLNIEFEVMMEGIITHRKDLFETGILSDSSLATAMAFCHPKARVRNVALFYFSVYLPFSKITRKETIKCSETDKVHIGSDAIFSPPSDNPNISAHQNNNNNNNNNTSVNIEDRPIRNNNISRKMTITNYQCMACKERCTNNCTNGNYPDRGNQHLSHSVKGEDFFKILNNSKVDSLKKLSRVLIPAPPSGNYTSKFCDRSSMCHSFFCRGIEPVSTSFSSDSFEKTKLVLYGKVVDVINSYSAIKTSHNNRIRVFFNSEEKDNKTIPSRAESAKNAFKDILVHECNKERAVSYFEQNKLSSKDGHLSNKWWIELNDLNIMFEKHVEDFYKKCSKVNDAESLKDIFNDFEKTCDKYKTAKRAIIGAQDPSTSTPSKKENGITRIISTLSEFHSKDEATVSALLDKTMLLGSRTIMSGVRCVIRNNSVFSGFENKNTNNNWELEIRHYVISMGGAAVTKISDEDLEQFTPVRGAVSVTTAPNDKLPVGAHQTWKDEQTLKTNTKRNSLYDSYNSKRNNRDNNKIKNRSLKLSDFNWRTPNISIQEFNANKDDVNKKRYAEVVASAAPKSPSPTSSSSSSSNSNSSSPPLSPLSPTVKNSNNKPLYIPPHKRMTTTAV
nr:wsv119 [Shrimp white spot syndrome virus]